MNTRRRLLTASAAAFAGSALPLPGLSQSLPRNARIIVGFPAGGSSDTVARLLAERLRGVYAPQVLVENRVGGGGRLAAETVKTADPDGTSILITPASIMTIYPHVYRRLSYDSFTDYTPVTRVISFPLSFSVGPAVPASVRTLADFVPWALSQGKPIAYGTPAAGSVPHFTGVTIGRALGVPVLHVPYKGGAASIQDLLGGQIPCAINVISEPLQHHLAGKLRILGQTGPQRSPHVPDVPTFVEAGFRDVAIREWFGAFLPARTPANIVAALSTALRDAVRSKEILDGFARFAFEAESDSPADFAREVRSMHDTWGPIIKSTGFTADD